MCRFQRVDQEARRKTTAHQTVNTGHPVSLVTGLSPLVILGVASAIPLVPHLHHHPCPLDAPHTQSVQRRHTSVNAAVWSTIMRSTALALMARLIWGPATGCHPPSPSAPIRHYERAIGWQRPRPLWATPPPTPPILVLTRPQSHQTCSSYASATRREWLPIRAISYLPSLHVSDPDVQHASAQRHPMLKGRRRLPPPRYSY